MLPTTTSQSCDRARIPAPRRAHRPYIVFAAAVWIVGIAFGVRALQRFESAPGAVGLTPAEWPAGSQIVREPGRMTLVMLVHPQCSCTVASLTELAEVMERARGRVNAWVLFVQPRSAPHSATWDEAAQLSGVRVGVDPVGAEATRFGALTSGHIVLYDPAGRLLFSGGITAARGHAGENMGRIQLLAMLDATTPTMQRHAVFGCALDRETVPRSASSLESRAAPRPVSAQGRPQPAGAR